MMGFERIKTHACIRAAVWVAATCNMTIWQHQLGCPCTCLQVWLLDGVAFKERGGETRQLGIDELRACAKFKNSKDEALLQPKGTASSAGSKKVILRLEVGSVP